MFPVNKLLKNNFDELFVGLEPALEDFKTEMVSNSLSKYIDVDSYKSIGAYAKIVNDPVVKIMISEELLQLLWCSSFSLVTSFDFGYKKPLIEGTYTGQFDVNEKTKCAESVFEFGMRALAREEDDAGAALIYCLQEKIFTDDYVSRASKIFACAVAFIINHELIHLSYGHSDYGAGKEDEYVADQAAVVALMKVSSHLKKTAVLGCVVGISSICFLPDGIRGGDTHPDTDDRIHKVIGELCLDDKDDAYGLVSMFYFLWLKWNKQNYIFHEKYQSAKELYDAVRHKVAMSKGF